MSTQEFNAQNWAASSKAKPTTAQVSRFLSDIPDEAYHDRYKNMAPAAQRAEIGRCESEYGFQPGYAQYAVQNKGDFAVKMGTAKPLESGTSGPKQGNKQGAEPERQAYNMTLENGEDQEFVIVPKGAMSLPDSKGNAYKQSEDMIGPVRLSASGKPYAKLLSIRKVRLYAQLLAHTDKS